MADKFKYDVAISFLAEGVTIAEVLYARLSIGLNVFFFPDRQKKLAGTDGLESMRAPFHRESRLNVVIYRAKWGKTRWTAIEEQAIIDSCLDTAFRSVFLYVVDAAATLPNWLPENHVYFSSANYTLDEAVGAIKARVQQRGAHYKPLTPARRAELNRIEDDYRRAKSSMLSQNATAAIHSAVRLTFDEIHRQCEIINDAGDTFIEYQSRIKEREVQQFCTIASGNVSLRVMWQQRYSNRPEEATLPVQEYSGNLIIPEGHIFIDPPEVLNDYEYILDVSRALEYGWRPVESKTGFLPIGEFASQILIQLLDLVNKDGDGLVERKNWD